MVNIAEFQRVKDRLEELKANYSRDNATLEEYQLNLVKYQDKPNLYVPFKDAIDTLQAQMNKDYSERESLQKYVLDNQALVGREIIEYLGCVQSDVNSYLNGSRAFSALTAVVLNIRGYLEELDSLLPLIESIHKEPTAEHKSNSVVEHKSDAVVDNLVETQILPIDYEFSHYVLHSRSGYSLKEFFERETQHVKKVLEYYDYDFLATLHYLQKTHGLCNGQTVVLKTFETLCIQHFGRKKKYFGLCLNGRDIEGETNIDLFINCLCAIGLGRIVAQCSTLFDRSLNISTRGVPTTYGVNKHVEEDGVIYHIRCHSRDGVKLQQLEHIKNILGLDLVILLG